LAGAVEAAGNALGVLLQPGGPIYGNEEAYANGKVVGQGAVLAAETAVFVSCRAQAAVGLAVALPAKRGCCSKRRSISGGNCCQGL